MTPTMHRLTRWILPSLAATGCLDDSLDSGACNHNHVCEPAESYEACPQDHRCWQPDDNVPGSRNPTTTATFTPS